MNYYLWAAVFILISVALGLIRILKGPTTADRMLAVQLLGTGGVGDSDDTRPRQANAVFI